MELVDHDGIPPPVIPRDMPDLQDLVRPSGDDATLDELLFYYAGLLKVGGTKFIGRQVGHCLRDPKLSARANPCLRTENRSAIEFGGTRVRILS